MAIYDEDMEATARHFQELNRKLQAENKRLRAALEWAYAEAQWVPEPSDACLAACRRALENENGTEAKEK